MGVNSNTLSGSAFGKALGGRLDITPSNISKALSSGASFATNKLDNLRKTHNNKDIKPESHKNKDIKPESHNNKLDQTNNLSSAHQVNIMGNFKGTFDKQESNVINPDGSKTTTTSFNFHPNPPVDQKMHESNSRANQAPNSGTNQLPTIADNKINEKKIENVKIEDFGKNKKAKSNEIKTVIEKFHQDKNINLFKNQYEMKEKGKEGENNLHFSYEEFSRYIANIGKAKLYHGVLCLPDCFKIWVSSGEA